jgi:hypothetical protein
MDVTGIQLDQVNRVIDPHQIGQIVGGEAVALAEAALAIESDVGREDGVESGLGIGRSGIEDKCVHGY